MIAARSTLENRNLDVVVFRGGAPLWRWLPVTSCVFPAPVTEAKMSKSSHSPTPPTTKHVALVTHPSNPAFTSSLTWEPSKERKAIVSTARRRLVGTLIRPLQSTFSRTSAPTTERPICLAALFPAQQSTHPCATPSNQFSVCTAIWADDLRQPARGQASIVIILIPSRPIRAIQIDHRPTPT
jgi:hypothetical protein